MLSTSADELTSFCQTLLTELLQHLGAIEERVHLIEASIQSFMKKSTLCKKIAEVPGIGTITATAIVAAVGDARQFRNGRHLSAWRVSCPDSIRLAASLACTASADEATASCGPCLYQSRGPFCAMHRQKPTLRASGFRS